MTTRLWRLVIALCLCCLALAASCGFAGVDGVQLSREAIDASEIAGAPGGAVAKPVQSHSKEEPSRLSSRPAGTALAMATDGSEYESGAPSGTTDIGDPLVPWDPDAVKPTWVDADGVLHSYDESSTDSGYRVQSLTDPGATPSYAPTNGPMAPPSGEQYIGSQYRYTLSCKYSDKDGYRDIARCYLLLRKYTEFVEWGAVYVYYDTVTNRIYLYDDSLSSTNKWIGGYAPGSPNVIESTQCIIHCAETTVSGSGNDLTVNWRVEYKTYMRGRVCNAWVTAYDKENLSSPWEVMGNCVINPYANAPVNVSLTPTNISAQPGVRQTITCTYRDSDGYGNLGGDYLLFRANLNNGAECVYLKYGESDNRLYLRTDDGNAWTGGYSPGMNNTFENSYAKVYAAQTTVTHPDAYSTTVTWSLEFKSTMAGVSVPSWMYVTDRVGYTDCWDQLGSLTVGGPAILGITADPALAKTGTTVTVGFTVAGVVNNLSATVAGGATSAPVPSGGSKYTCVYTILGTETNGSATIAVQGTDQNGTAVRSTSSGVLTIDTVAPVPGTATAPSSVTGSSITVNYSGASDATSGLKKIELWYKHGTSGVWTNSGLVSTTASGSFAFIPPGEHGMYYLDLVAEDRAGNRSGEPADQGDCCVSFDFADSVSGRSSVVYEYAYPGCPFRKVTLYDESGNQAREVAYGYGVEGELKTVSGSTDPVVYEYDGMYRPTSVTDGKGNKTIYNYNTAGYLSSVEYPGPTGRSASFGYDPAGNVTSYTSPAGVRTEYLRNDLNSLVTDVQYPATPGLNLHFDYDAYDRCTAATDSTGSRAFTYDDLDLISVATTAYTGLPARNISYGYNVDGSLASMGTPVGNFSYAYDSLGRPVSVTNPFGENFSWVYADGNALASQISRNSSNAVVSIANYAYDSRGFLASLENKAGDGKTILSSFSGPNGKIEYDAAGNATAVTAAIPGASSLGGTTSYTYDSKDQLTSEQSTRNGGFTRTYAYDSAGNRTTATRTGGGSSLSRAYNELNQFTTSGFVYGLDGNPTTYSNATLTYDAQDHLTGFGGLFSAGYGVDGLRSWKTSGGTRTYFLYSGSTPVCELDASGNVIATNTFGIHGLLNRHDAAGNKFYTFDNQGNTAQLLNSTGGITTTNVYDAYGFKLTAASDAPFGFGAQAGYYSDPQTGLMLLGLRYYDPQEGRFLTRDPIGYAGGMNLYAYCGGNPVGRWDPSGLAYQVGPDDADAWVGLNGYAATTGAKGVLGALSAMVSVEGNAAWNGRLAQIGASDYMSCRPLGVAAAQYGVTQAAGMALDVATFGDIAAIDDALSVGGKVYKMWKEGEFGMANPWVLHGHHLLPKEFAEWFAREGRDLNVDDWILRIKAWKHNLHPYGVHCGPSNWNKVWEEWIHDHKNAGAAEVLEQLFRMMDDFDLWHWV